MPSCDAPGTAAIKVITPVESRAIRTWMFVSGLVVARSASYPPSLPALSATTRVAWNHTPPPVVYASVPGSAASVPRASLKGAPENARCHGSLSTCAASGPASTVAAPAGCASASSRTTSAALIVLTEGTPSLLDGEAARQAGQQLHPRRLR